MRSLKNVTIGIAVFAMIILLSGLAFAEMGQGECKGCKDGKVNKETCAAQIKTLKDSATALQTSNPALAQELQKISEKKHMEKEATGK